MSTQIVSDAEVHSAEPGLWRTLVAALRGTAVDLTTVSMQRAVLLLAAPMITEMFMESLFALVNVFWMSHLGTTAVAIVGLTESLMTLLYAVAMGLSIAATAIVARRIGEKDPERAAHAAGQILLLGATISAVLGVVLGYFTADILRLMGADRDMLTLGRAFTTIMLGGNATVLLIFLINAIFRGAGDAVLAMRTLWLANGMNLVLAPCLIFGWGPFPELGITGGAVATNLGRATGVLYQLWHLCGGHGRVRVRLRHFKPVIEDLRIILTKASNGAAQLLISTTSWIGLYKILALSGNAAVAGYTIAIRIVVFALMPAAGLANAGATLVGQNLGAGQPQRSEQAIRIATRFNVILLGAVAIICVAMAGPIVSLFTTDAAVQELATGALRIVGLALPLYAAGMCMEAAFNGAGDTWTPTRMNFFCCWLGQVPLAWMLAQPVGLGPVGVFIAVPVSCSLLALWGWALFRRGRWKQVRV